MSEDKNIFKEEDFSNRESANTTDFSAKTGETLTVNDTGDVSHNDISEEEKVIMPSDIAEDLTAVESDDSIGDFSDKALAEGVVSMGIFGEEKTNPNDIKEIEDEQNVLQNTSIIENSENNQNNSDLSAEFEEMQKTTVINGVKHKQRKRKRRKTKVRKIVVRTYATVISAVLCIVLIYFASSFFQITPPQGMAGADLKVDMTGLPHMVGTEGSVDLTKMYPNGKNFKKVIGSSTTNIVNGILKVNELEDFVVSFTDMVDDKEETVEKDFQVVPNAVNVDNWESFTKELTTKRATDDDSEYAAICVHTPYMAAPSMEGVKKGKMEGYTVRNNIYGNGCKINVFEIVCCRNKFTGGKLSKPYLQGNGPVQGWGAFNILPRDNEEEMENPIIMQDLHIMGNDMITEEGGNLAGVSDTIIEKRGLKLFSNYGYLINLAGAMVGNEPVKANLKLKHCVLENGHQIIHVRNSNMEMEGNIIRNASDTTISIATYANEKSVITSRNNVIANSLTGGVVFYCYDSNISAANAEDSWNELEIVKGSFLDIYNWKLQDGLAFMPETESAAGVANPVAKSEIPKSKYDTLKAEVEGEKYIHFAIIKLRTGGGLAQNGSKVINYQDIGYQTSREKGYENGFPLPGVAAAIIKDIDVWGYYEKGNLAVTPTAVLNQETVEKLYEELKNGRS